jgi:hypothetical protein
MANQNADPGIPAETTPRPLTRTERRSLWLNEYEHQDIALQAWARLVEEEDQEIEVLFQMHGLLVFGTMVSTAKYAQFYIKLHEEMYRQANPETADFLSEYYQALIPPTDQPEIGPEGLPTLYRCAHLRDVTIISGGHKIKLPYWRGRINQIEAFVIGASAGQ